MTKLSTWADRTGGLLLVAVLAALPMATVGFFAASH